MNHQNLALKKSCHMRGREWGGYLLPVEIIALIGGGCQTHMDIPSVEERIHKGDCRPMWFYYRPTQEQLEKLELLGYVKKGYR